jgi:hypothetical protein
MPDHVCASVSSLRLSQRMDSFRLHTELLERHPTSNMTYFVMGYFALFNGRHVRTNQRSGGRETTYTVYNSILHSSECVIDVELWYFASTSNILADGTIAIVTGKLGQANNDLGFINVITLEPTATNTLIIAQQHPRAAGM